MNLNEICARVLPIDGDTKVNVSHRNCWQGPDPAIAPRDFLELLYAVAVQRAKPAYGVADLLPKPPKGRTVVIGAGKAAAAMAHAVEAAWPVHSSLAGLVVTRYHHTPKRPPGLAERIEIVEASHPVPDVSGMKAAQRMLDLVRGLASEDLVVCLISGGGSALLTLPAEGLGLEDKQRINRDLLESGASIAEMNCVRKHLSRIKGGRLAAACAPARVVTLAISDVPGDDPSVIASGPTVADASTCADAIAVLRRYSIHVPDHVMTQLEQSLLETPKPGETIFTGHELHLVATPQQALEAAARTARSAGLAAYILSDDMEGEAREVGKVHAALARASQRRGEPFAPPCVLLSGGETTVTIKRRAGEARTGRGGRAGEFCLSLAHSLRGQSNIWALAADTDGIDGVEDNAGALVTPDTLKRAQALGMKAEHYLDRNDSYGYFLQLGDLITTGPTYTNVNDFRAILVL